MMTLSHKTLLKFLIPVSLLGLSGCATILDGDTQTMRFKSDPPGALVIGDNRERLGVTPLTVEVSKEATGFFVIKKDGYKPLLVQAKHGVSPSSYWNYATLGFRPLFGMIDELTEARYGFEKTSFDVKLEREEKGL
jgi:hypothetical protein